MSFGKLRVPRLKVWHRKFLQNWVLGTVATTARPKVTRLWMLTGIPLPKSLRHEMCIGTGAVRYTAHTGHL